MEVDAVEEGPGGFVSALAAVDEDTLVAVGRERLYVRGAGEESWEERSGRWPAPLDDAGQSIFETVYQVHRGETKVANRLFEVVGDELWLVATPSPGERPRLLRSLDVGESWDVLELPEGMEVGRGDGGSPADQGGLPRFHRVDAQLYLIGGTQIYRRLGKPGTDLSEVEWDAIDLEGVDSLRESPGGLPTAVRHYLPANRDRPYEVVTTYGRDQRVYQRGDDEDRFDVVARRPAMDMDLVETPDGQWLWMTDGKEVMRSQDSGQEWEAVTVARHSLAPEDYRQIQVVEEGGVDEGYALLVFGDSGSLWRSDDGGESWETISSRDPDERAVTGAVYRGSEGVWIGTGGRGVWKAGDRDWKWEEKNEGMSQARLNDALFSGTRTLTVGSEAGLYRHRLDAPEDRWEELDGRATTAVWHDDQEGHLVTGTQGGAIVVDAEGEQRSSALAAAHEDSLVEFLPVHLQGLEMSAASILMIGGRHQSSDRLAWSHRRGAMLSNDGGESWRGVDFGQAFGDAVRRSRATSFMATEEDDFYLVTRSKRQGEPTQLWRSGDQGQLWQVTYSMIPDEEALPMRLMERPGASGLVMAYGSRLALSDDRGESWTNLSGPWEGGEILGITSDEDQIVVLYDLGRGSVLAWLDGGDDRGDVVESYQLVWPSRVAVGHRPVGLEVSGDRVLIQDRHQLYAGGTPRQMAGGPAQMSVVLGLAAVIALISLAFGYLRIWERRR